MIETIGWVQSVVFSTVALGIIFMVWDWVDTIIRQRHEKEKEILKHKQNLDRSLLKDE